MAAHLAGNWLAKRRPPILVGRQSKVSAFGSAVTNCNATMGPALASIPHTLAKCRFFDWRWPKGGHLNESRVNYFGRHPCCRPCHATMVGGLCGGARPAHPPTDNRQRPGARSRMKHEISARPIKWMVAALINIIYLLCFQAARSRPSRSGRRLVSSMVSRAHTTTTTTTPKRLARPITYNNWPN